MTDVRPLVVASLLLFIGCTVGLAELPGDGPHPPDAGPGDDAGAAADAGITPDGGEGSDAGSPDSGTPVPDAGPPDAGPPSHASCTQAADLKGATDRTAAGNPYTAYVPATYDPMRPAALVVALHGAGDTAQNYLQFMWRANADARGFIVIAPQGTYPYMGGFAWYGSDDALVVAAMNDVQKCYSVDPKRILLNGFSAGGSMAYFIGLSQAQLFSGMAIQSSSLSAGEYVAGGALLPAPWKVPVSHFHGESDPNFVLADALSGINRLQAAGHPVFWHPFVGGHQATAADALVEFDELKGFIAP